LVGRDVVAGSGHIPAAMPACPLHDERRQRKVGPKCSAQEISSRGQ
jgi:hypothetical protein